METGTNERRIAIWQTLCTNRQTTMSALAAKYHVCIRTIRYDIEYLSLTRPIETVHGRYGGCVKIADDYIPSKAPITQEQMDFLVQLVERLSEKEAGMMVDIIHTLSPQ